MPRASPRMTMAEEVHLIYLEIKSADIYKGSTRNEPFEQKRGTSTVQCSK